jgi:hypothetical protein
MSNCGPSPRGDGAAFAVVAEPPAAPASAQHRTVDVSGTGHLELRETVHLLREGDHHLLGFVLADDPTGELCLLALDMDLDDAGWCATVERVIRRRGGSHAPRGSTFHLTSR